MDKLLQVLDTNARLSAEQIAVMLGVSTAEVEARLEALEKAGVVRGYKALIDWDKTDREYVTAYIDLQIAPSKDRGFDGVAEAIMAFDEVESVTLMSGGYDLSVKITGRSFKDVAMFVAKRLSPLDGVLSTATHFVLKTYKERGVLFDSEEKDERGLI
ncbi:MAG: Lrp/AsnC family transcriptional regulator [Ruminococcaceae bacterium]|nr:Lrp/AsnC family transcriptional regulator [Oscillospiraceae bacterium]